MDTDNSNRLVFYSKVGKLQELACVNIASHLWYHDRKNKYEYYGTKTTIELSQLPTRIQDMIHKHVDAVSRSLNHWCTFNSYLFTESENENELCDFELVDLISWSADCTINYRQTAQKLVQSDELSGKQKYRVACVYCFPEDIKALMAEKHEYSHPLVQYWNCRLEDKANKLIAESDEYSSPEAGLLWNYKPDDDSWITLSAFQFFWEYLSDDERIRTIIERSRFLKKFLSFALCNIEERQLECVIESHAAHIMITLFHQSDTFVMLLWNHVKTRSIITVSSFYEIMFGLVEEFAYEAAFQIWISASDELRKGTLLSQNVDILLKQLICADRFRPVTVIFGETKLLMELLSAYPSEKRETFWKEQWKDVIVGASTSPEDLQMVMKLCLGCEDKIVLFKKMYMCEYSEIEYSLKMMIKRKRIQELCTLLTFVTNDAAIIYDLRIRIVKSSYFLQSYFGAWAFRSPEAAAPFDKFIDETFPDKSQLEDFKSHLMDIGTHSWHYFRDWIMNGEFDLHITGFYDHLFSSMPHLLNHAKNTLLEWFREALQGDESFSFTNREKAVNWCVNEDIHLLKKFKETIPIC
ncbi:uncharacterized protein LOC135831347 [Planococcus citri]|uniref:uncharacterized protein LOC135831347 n=1 Tax=Planococcus citri TaxID=170843 RepID=UPI0031F95F0A